MSKFNRVQKSTKTSIANVFQGRAIVYKIKSRSGEDLYTGIAGCGRSFGFKNPNGPSDAEHKTPAELLGEIEEKEQKIAEILKNMKQFL